MKSPFSLGRFEHDTRFRHAYYIPPELYRTLGSGVPTYLIGGRGTGKTTLLKAFEWRERLHNPYLREALGDSPFSDGVVGIYVKLSESSLRAFQRWFEALELDQSAAIFGLYFDLLWLEDFALAVGELARSQGLRFSVNAEREFLGAIGEEPLGKVLKISSSDSLTTFSRKVRDLRFALDQAALVRRPFGEAVKDFPITMSPGDVGRRVALLFSERVSGPSSSDTPVSVRVLIDEADSLTDTQHIIVNTIVRLAKAPLSYIFSSIKRFRDITTTTIPNLSVQRDDCQVVPLESTSNAQFKKLAEGVALVRLKKAGLGGFSAIDLFKWFGSSSINAILAEQLEESLSTAAKDLLDQARKIGRLPYFGLPEAETAAMEQTDDEWSDEATAGSPEKDWDKILPIYQTYLIKKLGLEVPAATAEHHVLRQKYAEVRKRMVAAYLDICRDLNLKPRYFGGRMILAMSDSSIRDFLLQMNELFTEAGGSIDTLANGRLSRREQDLALHRASEQKISSLPQWIRLPKEKVLRFVNVFGHLTHELQSGGAGTSHILTSEKGVFVLPKPFKDDGLDEHRKIIEECVITGYFSPTNPNDDGHAFRVHKVLAPHYGFSYRGAYAAVAIRPDHLRLILSSADVSVLDARKVAKDIAAAIESNDDVNQFKLSF